MLEKLFGSKKEGSRDSEKVRRSNGDSESQPVSRPSPPAASEPVEPSRAPPPPAAAERPREPASAAAEPGPSETAPPSPAPPAAPLLLRDFHLPEDAGPREEAAARFAAGEYSRAIDLLVGHLNKMSGQTPRSIWFMLMDAYQALGQQEAFEKSASMFANFFKTSPPSWEGASVARSAPPIGRNVMVIDGAPSQTQPEKLKDFLSASRQTQNAKLDLSRCRLDDDPVQRIDDLQVLFDLMRRLRRHQVPTLLMGENQLVEGLRAVIRHDAPVPRPELYWELLLEFLQWRGQEDAFEDLAIQYHQRFNRSAPGYEFDGVIALAPSAPQASEASGAEDQDGADFTPAALLDESAMNQWCDRVEAALPGPDESMRWEFGHVRRIGFDAAGVLAARLARWARSPHQFTVARPSELVVALFDITGVTGQVTVEPRKR